MDEKTSLNVKLSKIFEKLENMEKDIALLKLHIMGSGENEEEDLFKEAIKLIVETQKGSASYLQRKLGLSYNKCAKYLDDMEELGIVGPSDGAKPRVVIVKDVSDIIDRLE
jgi:DNA segregation ATPase FtsK/SpoIIIE-like protein